MADRIDFIDEFTRTVVAAAELDNFAPLAQLVDDWRSTAEIHADPKLARRLRRPISPSSRAATIASTRSEGDGVGI